MSKILPANRADWPEAAREDYEERAAILEYDAGFTRDQAEASAEAMVRCAWSEMEVRT